MGFPVPKKAFSDNWYILEHIFQKTQHRLLKVKLKFILISKQLFVMKNKFMVIWKLKSLKYYIADQGNTGFLIYLMINSRHNLRHKSNCVVLGW